MTSEEVELTVEAVALDWKGNPVVVLRERGGRRAVFIWVGISEATAISMRLEDQRAPRPLTHDLICTILDEVQVSIDRITIEDMRGETYYAMLHLTDGDESTAIDCRPSDAIALALRAQASIYISEALLSRLEEERREAGVELSPGTTIVEAGDSTVH